MILSRDLVDFIFDNPRNRGQHDIWLKLYQCLYPEWDRIESILDFPKCGDVLGTYIFERFIGYDRVHHPKVLAGGLWMNSGWSIDKSLGDWEARPAKVVMKKRPRTPQIV